MSPSLVFKKIKHETSVKRVPSREIGLFFDPEDEGHMFFRNVG
jgi:hypothetical protein